jgi:Tol biopolymer transport system component/DNA-binding winged helix-turn-helix (wHTH) protein
MRSLNVHRPLVFDPMTVDSPERPVRIGAFVLYPTSHELDTGGRRRRLPRLQARLLARLAMSPGQVVERERLVADVWQRTHVDPDVLSRNVADLRRALGDDAREPRYIETIPKGGYRLVAPVATAAEGDTGAPVTIGTAPARRLPLAIAIAGAAVALLGALAWRFWPAAPTFGLDGERPLTSDPDWELAPSLSANGAWVAFATAERGQAGTQLVVMAADGSSRRVLDDVAGTKVRLRFSPDGSRLAFLHHQRDRCDVRERALIGGPSRVVAACATGEPSSVDWSPDGRSLVYSAPADAEHGVGIARVDIADGSVQAISAPPQREGGDRDPRYSPDGQWVAFVRGREGHQHVRATTVASPRRERVVFPGGNRVNGVDWSPDGRRLIVGTDWPGYRALVEVDVDSGERRVIGARGGQYPDVSATGDLVYEMATYDANIWRADLAPGMPPPRAIIRSTRYDGSPVWSPAGDRFAFASTREDQETLWIAEPDGSNEHRLPFDPAHRWTHPSWSADGETMLATTYEDNTTWMYRHDLASGRSEKLVALGPGATDSTYTTDGREILFMRVVQGAPRTLWRIDAGLAGTAVQIAADVERFQRGDGVVVYSRMEETGLRVFDLATGADSPFDAPIGADNQMDWTVVGRTVWYAAYDPPDRPPALFRRGLDEAAPVRVSEDVIPNAAVPALAVSPDERTVLFVRTDEFRADLMFAPRAWR